MRLCLGALTVTAEQAAMEDLLVNPDAQTWQRWIIPLTGLASAILTLFLGRMVLQARWRKPAKIRMLI